MLGLGRAYRAEKGGKDDGHVVVYLYVHFSYIYIHILSTSVYRIHVQYHIEFMNIYVISRFRLSFSRCAHDVNEID